MADKILKKPFISARDEVKKQPTTVYTSQKTRGAYQLAFLDRDFLLREELRPVRLQLELLKPELIQQEQNIEATVVVFGSARLLEPSKARKSLKLAKAALAENPNDKALMKQVQIAQSVLDKARYYEEARKLGSIVSIMNQKVESCNFLEVTGAGPGIMEAANRGAHDVGSKSIGVSIVLPREEEPNKYVTPELTFKFHYFAIRKMHFLLRARALVAFPGGFGTLDELFESLTLMQTRKINTVPIILVGKEYWNKIINFQAFVDEGVIAPEDLNLLQFVETAEEAWHAIASFYNLPDYKGK